MCIARRSSHKYVAKFPAYQPIRLDMEAEALTKMLKVVSERKVKLNGNPFSMLNTTCRNIYIDMTAEEGRQKLIQRDQIGVAADSHPGDTTLTEGYQKFAELTESSCNHFLKREARGKRKKATEQDPQ